jgi:hypothetical protein
MITNTVDGGASPMEMNTAYIRLFGASACPSYLSPLFPLPHTKYKIPEWFFCFRKKIDWAIMRHATHRKRPATALSKLTSALTTKVFFSTPSLPASRRGVSPVCLDVVLLLCHDGGDGDEVRVLVKCLFTCQFSCDTQLFVRTKRGHVACSGGCGPNRAFPRSLRSRAFSRCAKLHTVATRISGSQP